MHSTSTSVLPDPTTSDLPVEEPTLFDNSIIDPRASGRPWSIVDPPLATVPESTLQVDDAPADAAADDLYDRETDLSSSDLEVSESASDVVCEAPSLAETCQDEGTLPANEAAPAILRSDTTMSPQTSSPRASFAADEAVASVVCPPPAEPAATADSDDEELDDRPAGPLFTPSAAPCEPPSSGIARSPRPAIAPKRIGSGCLVPARLTWKPRDPFAARGRSNAERFRWELMLTSACVTAVCGLGCVWLLRTLLA